MDSLKRLIVPVLLLVLLLALAMQYAKKASENRSAIVRWRPEITALLRGEDVYSPLFVHPMEQSPQDLEADPDNAYPNLPIVAIILSPLIALPPMISAILWYVIKAIMAWFAIKWSIDLATEPGGKLPLWAAGTVLLLSARPFVSDLKHGNINIFIFFLIIAALRLFSQRRDAWSGLLMGLAIVAKLTPALFIPYFAWKRSWKMLAATAAATVLFLLVIPSAIIGPVRNVELIGSWREAMIEPYLMRGHVETRQHNQSMPGLIHRLLTDSPGVELEDDQQQPVNVASLSPARAQAIVRIFSAGLLLWLAFVCRNGVGDRRNWALAGEYALILLAMLLLSERSWKHHYVTVALPLAVLAAGWVKRPTLCRHLAPGAMGAWLILTAISSEAMGGWLYQGIGHKYAQAFGAFMWAAVAMMAAISAILLRQRHAGCSGLGNHSPASIVAMSEKG